MIDRPDILGRLAVLAPLVFAPAVIAAAILPSWYDGGAPLGAAVGVLAACAAAWYALESLAPAPRAALSIAGGALSAALAWLFFAVIWPASMTVDGTLPGPVLGAYVFAPLLILPIVCRLLAKASRPRPARLGALWAIAVAALILSYPLLAITTTIGKADDMAMLVIVWIPAIALCIWIGPACAALIGRAFGRSAALEPTTDEVS